MLVLALTLLGMVVVLLLLVMWLVVKNPMNQILIQQNQQLLKTQGELLNRLQAPDLRTFQALQNFSAPASSPNDPYISRDDEAEAKYFKDVNGVGEIIILDDEKVKQYSLEDFGLDLDLP